MFSPSMAQRTCGGLLCAWLVVCVNVASAASFNNPGDQDLIRDRQNRLLEEQQRRLEQLKDLPGRVGDTAPSAKPEDSRCFPISDIALEGADALGATERERLLKPYLGQCLGVAQLNALLKAITDLYIQKGLVTSRAYPARAQTQAAH